MPISVLVLIVAIFLAGAGLGVLLIVLVGIRSEERRMSMRAPAGSHAEVAARRVLGLGVRDEEGR